MKRLLEAVVPTTSRGMMVFSFSLAISALAMIFFALYLRDIAPEWTNKSVAREQEDQLRIERLNIAACQEAGHDWILDGCTYDYPAPDLSWYMPPVRNQTDAYLEWLGKAVVFSAVALMIFGAPLINKASYRKMQKLRDQTNIEETSAATKHMGWDSY